MILRDVTKDDLPIFFAHQQEPEANRLAAFPPRAWEAFLAHWTANVLGDPHARKATILEEGQVAGNIGSWDQEGRRLVCYWIGQEFWGRGVATRALTEFLRLEPIRPLYAYVATHNIASIRVLEKCGFRQVQGSCAKGPDGVEEVLLRLEG